MQLSEVDAVDFVRAGGGAGGAGGAGAAVDVAAITKQVTSAATSAAVAQAVPAASQAAVQAVQRSIPDLVTQQTKGLADATKQAVKQELKPEHLYSEYQSGVWNPQPTQVVGGGAVSNTAVFHFDFPKPFSTKPVLHITHEGTSNRLFRIGEITNTGFDWSCNYSPLQVNVQWVAYVPKS